MNLRDVIAALGRSDFTLRDGTHIIIDGTATPIDPRSRPEWDEAAYEAAAAPVREVSDDAFWGVVEDVDGLRAQIDAAIEAIEDDAQRRAMRGVMRRRRFRYDSPSMALMRELVGMDQATFDALWADGEALDAALVEIE